MAIAPRGRANDSVTLVSPSFGYCFDVPAPRPCSGAENFGPVFVAEATAEVAGRCRPVTTLVVHVGEQVMTMPRDPWMRIVPGLLVGTLLLSGCGTDGDPSVRGDLAGIEFSSASSELMVDCQEAADQLGFAVPCPTEHPTTGETVRCAVPPDLRDAEVNPKDGCVIGNTFVLAINGSPLDGRRVVEAVELVAPKG